MTCYRKTGRSKLRLTLTHLKSHKFWAKTSSSKTSWLLLVSSIIVIEHCFSFCTQECWTEDFQMIIIFNICWSVVARGLVFRGGKIYGFVWSVLFRVLGARCYHWRDMGCSRASGCVLGNLPSLAPNIDE